VEDPEGIRADTLALVGVPAGETLLSHAIGKALLSRRVAISRKFPEDGGGPA